MSLRRSKPPIKGGPAPEEEGGSLRLLGVRLYIQSSERQASGTVLQLPARKLYRYRLHFYSDCLVRMYCIIIEDHKRM